MKSTINISFTMVTDEPPHCGATPLRYIDHGLLSISGHFSESKAKLTFRNELTETIERGLRALRFIQRKHLGAASGEVFTIYWSPASDGWCYDILGPGRKHASQCSGFKAFEEAVSAAKRHVDSSFGGIIWEC